MRTQEQAGILSFLLRNGQELSKAEKAAFLLQYLPIKPYTQQECTLLLLAYKNNRSTRLLSLSILLFSLRRSESSIETRAQWAFEQLSSVSYEDARTYLSTYVEQRAPLSLAVREFLTPPDFLSSIQQQLIPTPYQNIAHVSPLTYRHEEDIKATSDLEKNYPFEDLARFISKHLAEKSLAIQNTANSIAVHRDQFPELHTRFCALANRLGVSPIPKLFLRSGPLNAFTAGVEQTFVVLQEGAVSNLSPEELDFVIGHELGHVLFEHVLYQMIAQLAVAQGFILSPNALIGRILGMGMSLKIKEWARKAELSCDRAGVLACQNPQAAIRVLLRFAGVPASKLSSFNIEAYISQNDDFQQEKDSGLGKILQGLDKTHPFVIERIQELRTFVHEGHYQKILEQGKREGEKKSSSLAGILSFIPSIRLKKAIITPPKPCIRIFSEKEGQAVQLTQELSCDVPVHAASWSEKTTIFSTDHILYCLQAQALLSQREQEQLNIITQSNAASKTILIWGYQNLKKDEFDDGEPKEELKERIEKLLDISKFNIIYTPEKRLSTWKPPATKPDINALAQSVLQQISNQKINFEHISEQSTQTFEERQSLCIRRLESLLQETQTLLDEQKRQERIYQQRRDIILKTESIWKECIGDIFLHDAPNLSKRQEISPTMLATGIGSLGFGALIFPSLPLWAILTGLSIGATSLVGGKIEKQRREKSLLSQHKEEISAWFDQIQELAKKQINRQKEALEQDLLIIQEKGWSHYCEEIDIAWRASLNKTG